jgi:hypothetical protein
MTAIDKTRKLERKELPITALVKNQDNPNRMKPREFDLLCDNIEQSGLTDPILVRPLPRKGKKESPRYRIVGGHHRFDAAVYLGFEQVPCTIITDPAFDEDAERFQMVRMNLIRGQLDPQAFFDLYQKVADKYSDEILQEAFGFAEEREFQRLINQTAKQLPDPALQKKFEEATKEIKTIDGLSKLLNEMFTRYGDTLPYGFMVFDHGGQRSVWLQVSVPTIKAFDVIGEVCVERRRTVDDLVGALIQAIARGEHKALVEQLVAEAPEVELPAGLQTLPTKEHIAQAGAL